MEQGVDYCKRKVNLIADNLNKIAKVRPSQLLLAWISTYRSVTAGRSDRMCRERKAGSVLDYE
jgi:hypothetical protein